MPPSKLGQKKKKDDKAKNAIGSTVTPEAISKKNKKNRKSHEKAKLRKAKDRERRSEDANAIDSLLESIPGEGPDPTEAQIVEKKKKEKEKRKTGKSFEVAHLDHHIQILRYVLHRAWRGRALRYSSGDSLTKKYRRKSCSTSLGSSQTFFYPPRLPTQVCESSD